MYAIKAFFLISTGIALLFPTSRNCGDCIERSIFTNESAVRTGRNCVFQMDLFAVLFIRFNACRKQLRPKSLRSIFLLFRSVFLLLRSIFLLFRAQKKRSKCFKPLPVILPRNNQLSVFNGKHQTQPRAFPTLAVVKQTQIVVCAPPCRYFSGLRIVS